MVRRKPVTSLKLVCIKALPKLITNHIRTMVQRASAMTKWYGIFQGHVDMDRGEVLLRQIEALRTYIFDRVIWYDYELVFSALLTGVAEAIIITRQGWAPDVDMAHYRCEMEAMSAFTDIVLCPYLRKLDLCHIPKLLRSRIMDRLCTFTELRILIIGTGATGHCMFKSMAFCIAQGLKSLHKLEQFSCKHDCTLEIVEALAQHCAATIRVLDMENSKAIDDGAFTHIVRMTFLEELNIFQTRLSDESRARILMSLQRLRRLPRSDYLCDTLGWIDYLEEMDNPCFALTEFFPSQSYFFHEEWQMEMVARMCPFISKMFFIFHETCVENFLVLAPFEHLTDLCLYGGSFFTDRIEQLLEIRGHSLVRLSLISVVDVSYLALARISNHCPNLRSFGLSNCDLGDFRPQGNPNSDHEYERRQAFIAMAREAHQTVKIFSHLEEVVIQSSCKAVYLAFLLGRCPNLKMIQLGKSTEMTDEVLVKIYAQHGLHELEEFHCEKSSGSGLSMASLTLLLNNCEKLRALSDIQEWSGLTPIEVGQFRQLCHSQNLDLDCRSHQKLRKYLEMRGVERRTYLNLMAGPTLERIRMAQRAREEELQAPA